VLQSVDLIAQRREFVANYRPPAVRSGRVDRVTEEPIRIVPHANVVFFGPVGSGKSSLIGSLYRAVNVESHFPERVAKVLHHNPGNTDTHGTLTWMETSGNRLGTIIYQDTRGDQAFDHRERSVHTQALRGFFKDDMPLDDHHIFSSYWWSQRFFWERNLDVIPHAVVFVFDGSQEPFVAGESLPFFKSVFEDCTSFGYEPIVVVTCLDLMFCNAQTKCLNHDTEISLKADLILTEFDHLNLKKSDIYFVTNFHEHRGDRLWFPEDEGFAKASKEFVNLAMELTKLANRFIERKADSRRSVCSVS
jgi:hypothetical protein